MFIINKNNNKNKKKSKNAYLWNLSFSSIAPYYDTIIDNNYEI